MLVRVAYEDTVTPFINSVIGRKHRWVASALKSTGWWAQGEIKEGIKSGAPGGQKYPELSPFDLREKMAWKRRKPRKTPLGGLLQAVGYDGTKANQGEVLVGWLSRTAVHLGSMHEKGFSKDITGKMRRKFNKIGSKLLGKGKIVIPARPTFAPMRQIIDVGAVHHFQTKIIDYLNGETERSVAKSKRRYTVYT